MDPLLAALAWNPEIKGALYVVLSVAILCGSVQLILSTNLGARVGYQVAACGLFGIMTVMGIMWWAYAIGPVGTAPSWVPQQVIEGDIAASIDPRLNFPVGWEELAAEDAEVADAQPVVDGQLVAAPGESGVFASAGEYTVARAYQVGGETYGPFGLSFRPLDLFHKPRHLVVEVEAAPDSDAGSDSYAVLMVRDLGSERLNPAVFTVASALVFGIYVYQLHIRDRRAMAKAVADAEEAAAGKDLASTKS